jgi:hypothetical protein
MQAFLLFQKMPTETAAEMLQYLRENEREAYKSVLSSLAVQRKLRPVFIQKRPVEKQIAWMIDSMKLRVGNDIGEQVIQVWLMKANKEMLVAFLDAMKIEHDGEGSIENLPETLDAETLKTSVGGLLEKYPAHAVSLYLNVFQSQRADGWPALGDLIAADPRLQIGTAA